MYIYICIYILLPVTSGPIFMYSYERALLLDVASSV